MPSGYAVGMVLLSGGDFTNLVVVLNTGDIYEFKAPLDVFSKDFSWTKLSSSLSNPGKV